MSCGVGSRRGLDLALLWLWCRPAAVTLIRPLAWEPPYAADVALKRQKEWGDRGTPWLWCVTGCPQVSYPYPPQRRAPAITSNNPSETGQPSPGSATSAGKPWNSVNAEFGIGPQVLYAPPPPWYPSPTQTIGRRPYQLSCSVTSHSEAHTGHPHPMFRLPQEIIWQNTTQTSHCLSSAWPGHPSAPLILLGARLDRDHWMTHLSPPDQ